MAENKKIPYKIYLEESEMPTQWYNVRADMKNKPAPLLNPATLEPMKPEELEHVFCKELVQQELDDTTPYFDIPQEIRDFYKMYRPSPLVRAYCLEKALDTPAKIYYKFEGNNTSGSHKLNSAIAQAYYAKKQGLKGVTTETGAGQWGTALSMACSYFDLDCRVSVSYTHLAYTAPNIVNREFEEHGPRKILLTDITYIINGKAPRCYMSTIIDACTKELLSWVLSESLEIDFVLETVKQLIEKHGTDLSTETLIHSDQGCLLYTSCRCIR